MEAYRDQYATLFKGGRGVTVIGISVDPDTTLASWAREKKFPMLFASDSSGAVGKRYGAFREKFGMDDRSLFVIAPNGTISYEVSPFNQLSRDAYTELAAAVKRADGRRTHGSPSR